MDLLKAVYGDLRIFMAVVRNRSFRGAAAEIGVTPSAISHSISRLEARMKTKLLQRNSRSVTPTGEGAELAGKLVEGFDLIEAALTDLRSLAESPSGVLRLNVPHDASRLLVMPALRLFAETCPDVQLSLVVEDKPIDLIGEGFDAGIRYGDKVTKSMVAVALTQPLRWVSVASPDYLRRHGTPMRPADLRRHECNGMLLGDRTTYAWELGNGDAATRVNPAGRYAFSDTQATIDAALQGVGIAYVLEERVRSEIDNGSLQVVMPDWASMGVGMYMYYPSRKRKLPALNRLINIIRKQNGLVPIVSPLGS